MLRNNKKWGVQWWPAGLLIVFFFALHQIYISRMQPDAVYMDSLRLLYQWQEWNSGRMSFVEFWGQGSAHRGFINQALMIANIELFSLDVLAANRLTGAVMAVFSALLTWVAVGSLRDRDVHVGWGGAIALWLAAVLGVALIFSWAGFELLTLDLGLPLWIKNFCFLLYFVGHSRLLLKMEGDKWTLFWLTLFGVCIILLVGMGWSYAFVGAVLFVHTLSFAVNKYQQGNSPWAGAWVATIALVIALAAYSFAGNGIDSGDSPATILKDMGSLVYLVLTAVGATWIGGETAAQFQGILQVLPVLGGISVVLCIFGIYWRIRRGIFSQSLLPLYLVSYGGLVAVSVSIARGSSGGEAAVIASRYFMDVMFLQLGVIWLFVEELVFSRAVRARILGIFFSVFAIILGAGLAATYWREWQVAPYRAIAFVEMNNALLAGVPDQKSADLLQSPLAHARRGAKVMREQQLSIFAGRSIKMCDLSQIQLGRGWHVAEPQGSWLSAAGQVSLPACECPLSVSLYLPDSFSSRELVVDDSTGVRQEILLEPGKEIELVIAPSLVPRTISLTTSETTVPSRDLANKLDGRELGLLWTSTAYMCAAAAQ